MGINKSQMLQYAEFFNTESEKLRKRRVRMKILDWQHLATIGKGGFGNVNSVILHILMIRYF
jgi:hypothetical protein